MNLFCEPSPDHKSPLAKQWNVKKRKERSVGDACYEKGSSRIVTNSKMEKYHHRDRKECGDSLRKNSKMSEER
jgi:hypothetical protein